MFKDIPGYEGLYKINIHGVVFSYDRVVKHNIQGGKHTRIIKGRERKSHLNRTGYFAIDLQKEGKRKKFLISRLVALTFIENPYNKREVNHIDGNPKNNHVSNLEWVTTSENIRHSFEKLGRVGPWKGKFGYDNPTSKPVKQIDKHTGKIIKIFGSVGVASRALNIPNTGNIALVCKGKRKSAAGYKWEYA